MKTPDFDGSASLSLGLHLQAGGKESVLWRRGEEYDLHVIKRLPGFPACGERLRMAGNERVETKNVAEWRKHNGWHEIERARPWVLRDGASTKISVVKQRWGIGESPWNRGELRLLSSGKEKWAYSISREQWWLRVYITTVFSSVNPSPSRSDVMEVTAC